MEAGARWHVAAMLEECVQRKPKAQSGQSLLWREPIEVPLHMQMPQAAYRAVQEQPRKKGELSALQLHVQLHERHNAAAVLLR